MTKPDIVFEPKMLKNFHVCQVSAIIFLPLSFKTHTLARIYRPSFRENKPKTGSLNSGTGISLLKKVPHTKIFRLGTSFNKDDFYLKAAEKLSGT
jgi:hypothetical protein